METEDVLVELLTGKKITVQGDAASLNSLRVMLYRKLQSHISQWDAVGYLKDELRDTTISMDVDKKAGLARFSIVKRKPRLQFTILKVEPHEKVSTDLEHDQDSSLQHGSTNQDSSQHGADSHPSCSQGEGDGQRSAEEDWESQLRKFIQQDSDGRTE